MLGMCSPKSQNAGDHYQPSLCFSCLCFFWEFRILMHTRGKKETGEKLILGKKRNLYILSDISNLLKNLASISLKEVQGLDEQCGMIKLLSEEKCSH